MSMLPLNFPKNGGLISGSDFAFVDGNFRGQEDFLTIFQQPRI